MTEAELAALAARWCEAMRAGDWEAAWRETDRIEVPRRREEAAGGFAPGPQHLRWNGRPFAGRSVLVRCLHGLGDTLQFMRFVPLLARQARELHFLVQPPLLDLLRGVPGLGHVSNGWTDEPPAHEVEIEVMELAYALRATPDDLPRPAGLAAHVQQRQVFTLPAPPDIHRVGLIWSCSHWGRERSLPMQALAPLLGVPGVRFYDLQQDESERPPGLVPLWRQTGSVLSAAAAMQALDLLIAVDSMPAHLAGTLGVPTWLMLRREADWRWGRGPTTPWYPSMRLFRQRTEGAWEGVIEETREALRP